MITELILNRGYFEYNVKLRVTLLQLFSTLEILHKPSTPETEVLL